jgi:hypothetical protein
MHRPLIFQILRHREKASIEVWRVFRVLSFRIGLTIVFIGILRADFRLVRRPWIITGLGTRPEQHAFSISSIVISCQF